MVQYRNDYETFAEICKKQATALKLDILDSLSSLGINKEDAEKLWEYIYNGDITKEKPVPLSRKQRLKVNLFTKGHFDF